jgi:hypothetical protein
LANEIDLPAQALADLYAVTGLLVVNWGLVEASLTTLINTLYKNYGGDVLGGKSQTLPVSFKRRMKYIKACFKEKEALAPYAEEAKTVRSRARELSFVRDYIAHGHLHHYDHRTGIYTFGRLDSDGNETGHIHTVFEANAQQLIGFSHQLMDLFARSHALAAKLVPAKP